MKYVLNNNQNNLKAIVAFSYILLFTFQVNAQLGTLDESFGEGGKVLINDIGNCGYDLGLQSTGKIVTLGSPLDIYPDRAIIRLNANGSLDSSFGEKGFAHYNFNYETYTIFSIAVQKDDKIVIGGYGTKVHDANNGKDSNNILLARYLRDGNLDKDFGENGYVFSDLGNQEYCKDIKILADGKILSSGSWSEEYGAPSDFLLVRYLNDGSLDKSFGANGKVITGFGEWASDGIGAITIQKDGKIVAGGGTGSVTSNNSKLVFARYMPDGNLDESFGTKGQNVIDITTLGDEVNSIGLLRNGNIIACGFTGRNSFGEKDSIFLLSLNSDGTINKNFGSNGIVSTKLGGFASFANAMAIENDDKIIIAGSIAENKDANANFLVSRFMNDGQIDSSFGENGIQTTDFGLNEYAQFANSVLIQPDGKIITAGLNLYYANNAYNLALARYLGDPTHPLITKIKTWIRKHILHFQNSGEDENITYYVVEQSNNEATGFKAISHPLSVDKKEYSYLLPTGSNETSYYRIKAVQKDNSIVYSSPISSASDDGANANSVIIISPNPATNFITLSGFDAAKNYELRILNKQGNIFNTKKISSNSSCHISITDLQSGLYFIKISDGEKESNLKFIKE